MRKASLERMKQIGKQERALKLEKTLTMLKAAINNEMVKTARSHESAGDADKLLVLGVAEYKLLMENMFNPAISDFLDMTFALGQPPCKIWNMDIVVLPTMESFIGVAVNKLEDDLLPHFDEEEL